MEKHEPTEEDLAEFRNKLNQYPRLADIAIHRAFNGTLLHNAAKRDS